MFCKRCGKEIENDALFCTYCGCDLSEMDINGQSCIEKSKKKRLKKEFDFGFMEMNERGIKAINEWLVDKNIYIVSVEVVPRFTFFPIAQTSIRHVEINYEEIENDGYRYQFGVESYSSLLMEDGCKRVTRMFEKWKENNRDKTVVWKTIKGHDYVYNNFPSNTASLYYLFKENNTENNEYEKRIKTINRDIFFTNIIGFVMGIFILMVFAFIISVFTRVYF